MHNLPGTPKHQKLLKTIVEHYNNDDRILAILVFGSLGRGNWDRFSDADLDIVLADNEKIIIQAETERLGKRLADIGERLAILITYGSEEADLVFESLLQLSIRYHPLSTTSPNILDSMLVLAGSLDYNTIRQAGLANKKERVGCDRLLNQCVRYAVDADTALQRGKVWITVEIIHRMRSLVMEMFSCTHNGVRGYQSFENDAGSRWQKMLGETLPSYSPSSLHSSLVQLINILESGLDELTAGQVQLNEAQKKVLHNVRARHSDREEQKGTKNE